MSTPRDIKTATRAFRMYLEGETHETLTRVLGITSDTLENWITSGDWVRMKAEIYREGLGEAITGSLTAMEKVSREIESRLPNAVRAILEAFEKVETVGDAEKASKGLKTLTEALLGMKGPDREGPAEPASGETAIPIGPAS